MSVRVLGEVNTLLSLVLCPVPREFLILPSSGQFWYKHMQQKAKKKEHGTLKTCHLETEHIRMTTLGT